jgi:flavin reductase (DIM6/NTAB) family NADH-FMN oxidoreductase RutF
MQLDFQELTAPQRYKLLVSLIVPRPIALVTTTSQSGLVNAAPFSFFNVFCDEPPVIILGIAERANGALKDTARNIIQSGEFVVNMVDKQIAEAMHACATDLPSEESELALAGLTEAASVVVKPPRIAESPASLECKLHTKLELGTYNLFVGQVHMMHARDGLIDPKTLRVEMSSYQPVGRLFANRYCTTDDQFVAEKDGFLQELVLKGRL